LKTYALGDIERFWLHDITRQKYFEVEAKLEVIRPGGYFWVQVDQTFSAEALERGATGFDETVLPKVRALYGTEWSPGIDGDPRVHVLHHEPVPGIAGYFYSVDEYPRSVEPHSNEREMFYVNVSVYTPGSFDYLSLLAHELQHMIHWASDRNEAVWANEGLAELSSQVAGYRTQKGNAFTENPDTALMEWSEDPAGNAQHYASSYTFFAYLLERFGEPVIRAFVEAQADGVAGVEEALEAIGQPSTFDQLFLEWVVANALPQDLSAGDPRYGYGNTEIRRVVPGLLLTEGDAALEETVQPYGTDYYELTDRVRDGGLSLEFEGDKEVGLLEVGGGMAEQIAWSGRGDNLDSMLTLEGIQLPPSTAVDLFFETRFEIEEHWDYAYLMISDDGGQTWAPLETAESTQENPNANNLGHGITGRSQGWRPVEVRFAPYGNYAGKTVDLRWEMISDDAVSLSGMAIRSIELRFLDRESQAESMERWTPEQMTKANGFVYEGWRRVPALLPQRWGLQLIISGEGAPEVIRIPVAEDGKASIARQNIPAGASLTLSISAMTPATRQAARYELRDLAGAPVSTSTDLESDVDAESDTP
jgi:hypothetical protein